MNSGQLLVATGLLHTVVGFVEGGEFFGRLLADGWLDSVGQDYPRMAIFWFIFGGFMIMLYGLALHDYERATDGPPGARHGWYLVLLSLAGGLAIPVSGFWLVLPQGIWIIRRQTSG